MTPTIAPKNAGIDGPDGTEIGEEGNAVPTGAAFRFVLGKMYRHFWH
jgi:hypothetical protein